MPTTKNGKAPAKPRNRITVKKTKPRATPAHLEIPAPDIQTIKFRIVGDSQLVTHAWSKKAREMMLAKQQGKKLTKAPKDPWQDYLDSMYWVSKRPAKVTEAVVKKAKFGFPATAIKAACVAACRGIAGIKMTEARQLIFVESDFTDDQGQDLIIIDGKPKMIESMVRLQTGVADLRYRGCFMPWSATVRVQFDAENIAAESVVNLVNRAGLTCGICEWRPASKQSSTGMWGRFHVEAAS